MPTLSIQVANEMAKVKSVRLFPFAKMQAFMMGIVGLVAGIVYSVGGALVYVLVSIGWISSVSTSGVGYGTALAFLAIVGMPIIFATFGLVLGVIEALLYNIFARWFGGIEIGF